MREIKFRAWDNVKNEMYYTGETVNVVFTFDSNGIIATDITESDENFKALHHLAYMEFTGLQDKNGTPIYEGDILNVEFVHNEKEKFTVVWSKFGARFGLLDAEGDDWGFTENNEYEVIGNIHENKEVQA